MLLGVAILGKRTPEKREKLPKNSSMLLPFSIALHPSRFSYVLLHHSPRITHHSSTPISPLPLIYSTSLYLFNTYRNWGDPEDEAIDASADSPGN
jgi:hypothetical protein